MIHLENHCEGKQTFKTKESANSSAAHLNSLGGRRVCVYRCRVCSKFHIGHNSKGKKLKPNDSYRNTQIDFIHEPGIHIVDVKNTNLNHGI